MALLLLDFVNFRFHSQGTIVEGVGDEVLIGLASTLGLIALVSILYNTQGGPRNIHPSQEEHVQIVRDRLGVGREDGSNPTASEGPVLPDPPPVTYSSDQRCPVCLTETKFHTTTNCGHVYCAPCIVTYWRYGRWLGAVNCPVCRQQVTILFPNFSDEDVALPEAVEYRREINEYNRRYSGVPRPIMDYLRDLPTLLRQLCSELFSVGGLVWVLRLRITLCFFAAALYFISPLDIIPESVFGFLGLMDDVLIILLLLVYVTEMYRRVIANRAEEAT
ncbi:E3 ubiquitin-protein ligase RNF170-like isoform X1 [Montipora capricornis]|uniref:E3 ubiquitin-protein ligase RNF170-like isoform X1 n=1 Tax=Montipora capricornis TaxID=246305 RepID=UPI0035F14A0B